MHKRVLLVTVIAFIAFGSLGAAEDEMCVPMGDITIETLAHEAKRSEVSFPHAVHFSYSCRECHHTWNAQEPIVGCKASGCHDLAEKQDSKDASLKIRYFKEAYHTKCIGCHKDIKIKNQKLEASGMKLNEKLPVAGPTGCNQCHPPQ
jgi:hypothetical protein